MLRSNKKIFLLTIGLRQLPVNKSTDNQTKTLQCNKNRIRNRFQKQNCSRILTILIMYYNTTNEKQPELALARKHNDGVDEDIKKIFTNHPNGLTAYEVFEIVRSMGYKHKESSVRRSCTDLFNGGYLILTDDKRLSSSGRPNKVYRKK